MKKKINWWAILAVLVIGVPVGYVGMGVVKKAYDKWKNKEIIEQEPELETAYLKVAKNSFTIKSKDGVAAFEIASNTEWSASIDDETDWLTIEPAEGNGNTVVTLTAVNNSTGERSATVKVSWKDGDDIEQVDIINVTQEEGTELIVDEKEQPIKSASSYLSVNKKSISFVANGGSQAINITSDTNWSLAIKSGEEWLSANVMEGRGNKVVTLRAMDNAETISRNAKITISWNDDKSAAHSTDISVTQRGTTPPPTPFLTTSSGRVTFKANGGNSPISVKSNTNWEVTTTGGDGWLSVNPVQGNGQKTVVLKASANASTIERTATMRFSWKDDKGSSQSSTVSITQAGATLKKLYLSVTPVSVNFAANGGTKSLSVKSNTDWKVTIPGNDDWLTVSPLQSNGDKKVSVTAKKNTDNTERKATLTFTWKDEQGVPKSESVSLSQGQSAPVPITAPEAQSIVGAGKASDRVPDDCVVTGLGINTTYGAFRKDLANGKYSSVQVTVLNTDKNTGNATKINVKVSAEPSEGLTKEEAQTILSSGQRNSKVPEGTTIIINNNTRIDYQNFRVGVKAKTYTNIKVTNVNPSNGKVTSIMVTAKVNSDSD